MSTPLFPTALTQSPERVAFVCSLAGRERGWPAKSSTWAAPSLILQHGEEYLLGLINATSAPAPGFEYRQLLDRVYNISDSHALWKAFGVLLSAYRAHAAGLDKDFFDYLLEKETKQARNRTANCVDALVILMNAAPAVLLQYMEQRPFRWNWLGRAGRGMVDCFRDPAQLETIVKGALTESAAHERPLEMSEFEALVRELMEPSVLPRRNWSADPEVSQFIQPGITWPKQEFMGTVCPCTVFFCGQAGSGKTNCARDWLDHMRGTYTKVYLAAKDDQQPIYREMVKNQGRHGFSVQPTDLEQLEGKHFEEGNRQPIQQKLLWCDDQIGAVYPKSLKQLVNTGRHKGWSTWILSQSYTEMNIDVRRGMNYYILKRMGCDDDVARILRQRGLPRAAVDVYKQITADVSNFFMIDMVGGETTRFRKNFTPIAALRQMVERPLGTDRMEVDDDSGDEGGAVAPQPAVAAPLASPQPVVAQPPAIPLSQNRDTAPSPPCVQPPRTPPSAPLVPRSAPLVHPFAPLVLPHPSSPVPHPSSTLPHPSFPLPHPSSPLPHPSFPFLGQNRSDTRAQVPSSHRHLRPLTPPPNSRTTSGSRGATKTAPSGRPRCGCTRTRSPSTSGSASPTSSRSAARRRGLTSPPATCATSTRSRTACRRRWWTCR